MSANQNGVIVGVPEDLQELVRKEIAKGNPWAKLFGTLRPEDEALYRASIEDYRRELDERERLRDATEDSAP